MSVIQAIIIANAIETKVIRKVLRVPSDTDSLTKAPVVIVVLLAKSTCFSSMALALLIPFSANAKLAVAAAIALS